MKPFTILTQYLKFLMREQGKRILKPEKNAPGLTRATLTASAKNNGSGKKKDLLKM